MSWIRKFTTICVAVLVVVLLALVLLVSFVDLGLSGHGIAALFIGSTITVVLAMVLMGLLFLSDRTDRDIGR